VEFLQAYDGKQGGFDFQSRHLKSIGYIQNSWSTKGMAYRRSFSGTKWILELIILISSLRTMTCFKGGECIMYLEGYLNGCWMYALTILCMASM
jgi:hypothetical protein